MMSLERKHVFVLVCLVAVLVVSTVIVKEFINI